MVEFNQQRILDELPARMEYVSRGFDHQAAELAQVRAYFREKARAGDRKAAEELSRIKEWQRSLKAAKNPSTRRTGIRTASNSAWCSRIPCACPRGTRSGSRGNRALRCRR